MNPDTAAANAALAYLGGKGGGKLYLPPGKVVFDELTMPYNGLSIECPWTDSTQILPGSGSGNTIVMGSGTGVGATTVFDLEVNNCTFVPKTGNVQTGGSYVIINNANTTRLTNTRHFGGYKPVSITNNSVINYVTQVDFVGTASNNGVDITIAGGGDQFLSNINAVGASGGTQPNACINIQESGGVWLTNIDCISQGNGLLINPTGGKQVLWTFGNNIAFDTGTNGLNVVADGGGIVKGLSIYGLWTSSNTNWGATFTGTGGLGGAIDQVELVGHRSYNNGRDGAVIAFGGNYTINGGSYCGNSATTPGVDSGINIGVGMNRVSVLNARIGSCVGYGATQARGIILQPSAVTNNILIVGNDLTGNVNPVFNGVTTPGGVVIFANNIGYADSAVTTINGVACLINASCVVGGGAPSGAAGGALAGTYPNPTLATVNANVGSFGSSTSIPSFTVTAGGQITAASANAVVASADTLTGATLAAGVTGSSLTSVGTLVGGATGAGFTLGFGTSTQSGNVLATHGGTGQSSFAVGDLLYADTTTTIAKLADVAANNVLLSGGVGVAPSWGKVANAALSNSSVTLAGTSVSLGASAALPNKFIVQGTTDAGLSGAQFLGALGTGLVKNTTTTGVLSIATAGTDYLTSVGASFTGGLISVGSSPLTANGTLAFSVAGTSGGIPYFSSTSGWASSALLTANALMIGGGAGVAPATTTTGTGVLTALGVNVGTAGSFVVNGGALGTPSSGTLSSATGLPISTGVSGLGTGVATFLGTPSSANLAAAITDETGTGAAVFATSPTLVTPVLGVASATSVSTSLSPTTTFGQIDASGATMTIASGATNTLAVGSGLLMLNDTTVNGAQALYMVGGGGVVLIAVTNASYFAATSSPAVGQIGLYFDTVNYRIKNNTASSVTLGSLSIKTRAAN